MQPGRSVDGQRRACLRDQQLDLSAAQNHRSRPGLPELFNRVTKARARFVAQHAMAKLFVYHAMDQLAGWRVGNNRLDAEPVMQPVAVEALFHSEPGSQQAGLAMSV